MDGAQWTRGDQAAAITAAASKTPTFFAQVRTREWKDRGGAKEMEIQGRLHTGCERMRAPAKRVTL